MNLYELIPLISEEIGVYGKRNDNPIILEFGNGVCLRDKFGRLIASGIDNCPAEIYNILAKEAREEELNNG